MDAAHLYRCRAARRAHVRCADAAAGTAGDLHRLAGQFQHSRQLTCSIWKHDPLCIEYRLEWHSGGQRTDAARRRADRAA